MKLRYDKSVDAAYLYIAEEGSAVGPVSTIECDPKEAGGMINLDFDSQNMLLGIELIPASKFLSPSLLADSE